MKPSKLIYVGCYMVLLILAGCVSSNVRSWRDDAPEQLPIKVGLTNNVDDVILPPMDRSRLETKYREVINFSN